MIVAVAGHMFTFCSTCSVTLQRDLLACHGIPMFTRGEIFGWTGCTLWPTECCQLVTETFRLFEQPTQLLHTYTNFCQKICNEEEDVDGKRSCVEVCLRIVLHVIRGLEVPTRFGGRCRKFTVVSPTGFEFLTNLTISTISEEHTTQICCLFFKRFARWKIDSSVVLQVRVLQ
jgi:hypothetical protein